VKVKLDAYTLWMKIGLMGGEFITQDVAEGIVEEITLGTQVSHTRHVYDGPTYVRRKEGGFLKIKPDKPGYCRIYQTG